MEAAYTAEDMAAEGTEDMEAACTAEEDTEAACTAVDTEEG